jgi:hypothetical protein
MFPARNASPAVIGRCLEKPDRVGYKFHQRAACMLHLDQSVAGDDLGIGKTCDSLFTGPPPIFNAARYA